MAATEKFTKADLDYIYSTMIDGGAKKADVARILKTLPAEFTLEELKSKANLSGLSSKSRDLWSQALSTLDSAVAAAPPSSATPPATTTGSGAGGGTAPMDNTLNYMAPTGPSTSALGNLFLGNTPAQQTGLPPWQQGPFQSQPSPAEMYGLGRLASLQPTAPSALENLIGLYAGRGPTGMTPAASGFEQNLGLLSQNPYLAQIAAGQIPQSMMDLLNSQMALSRANTLEATGMGGALTSSDLAEGMARAENDARTGFLASMADKANAATNTLGGLLGTGGGLYNTRTGLGSQLWSNLLGQGLGAQQARQNLDLNTMLGLMNPLVSTGAQRGENALTRYLGLGQGLAGMEQAGGENATNRMFQDFTSSKGLPPEIAGLLQLIGYGAGKSGTSTGGNAGALGGDLLGAIGNIGGSAVLGSMLGGGGGAGAAAGLGAGTGGSLLGGGLGALGAGGGAAAGGGFLSSIGPWIMGALAALT